MDFDSLRQDLNNLFYFPDFGFTDPFDTYDHLRRRAMDIFDNHTPQLTVGDEPASSESGNASIVKAKTKTAALLPRIRWIPRCDAEETKDSYIIRAELPGIEKSNIHIEYDDSTNILTLSGNNQAKREDKKETAHSKYHFIERSSGQFSRSFQLPSECKKRAEEIHASKQDGVLEIICPKQAEKKTEKKLKTITVQ